MKKQRSRRMPLPPRLNMEEFAEFVLENLRGIPAERIARQKEIEERISSRFRLDERRPHPGA